MPVSTFGCWLKLFIYRRFFHHDSRHLSATGTINVQLGPEATCTSNVDMNAKIMAYTGVNLISTNEFTYYTLADEVLEYLRYR